MLTAFKHTSTLGASNMQTRLSIPKVHTWIGRSLLIIFTATELSGVETTQVTRGAHTQTWFLVVANTAREATTGRVRRWPSLPGPVARGAT